MDAGSRKQDNNSASYPLDFRKHCDWIFPGRAEPYPSRSAPRRFKSGGGAMSYKILLAAVAIFMACGPALAQNDQTPSSARPAQATQNRGACRDDVRRLCTDVSNPRPRDKRVFACLLKHEKELTAACKESVERHRAALQRRGGANGPSNPR
jgi:hypothetical protein